MTEAETATVAAAKTDRATRTTVPPDNTVSKNINKLCAPAPPQQAPKQNIWFTDHPTINEPPTRRPSSTQITQRAPSTQRSGPPRQRSGARCACRITARQTAPSAPYAPVDRHCHARPRERPGQPVVIAYGAGAPGGIAPTQSTCAEGTVLIRSANRPKLAEREALRHAAVRRRDGICSSPDSPLRGTHHGLRTHWPAPVRYGA